MLKDLNCKWNFARREANDQISGPNNPTSQNFRGNNNPFYSLMREVLQNSLDARRSFSEPVKVKFSFRSMKVDEYPELFNLESTLTACKEFYPDNEQASEVYDSMLAALARIKEEGWAHFLCIQDEGTVGMDYVPVQQDRGHNNKFLSFMRSLGVHSQQINGVGGSYGFGKATYFELSPLSTVLTTTHCEDAEGNARYFFEGTTWLSTHRRNEDDDRTFRSHVGYYDSNNGEPVADPARIPDFFRRNSESTGTTFHIMGIEVTDRQGLYNDMLLGVLDNFWLAVYSGELEVEIGDQSNPFVVSKDTLLDMIGRAEEIDETFAEKKCVRQFLAALNGTGKGHIHRTFDLTEKLGAAPGKSWGKVDIYAIKDQSGINKFQRQRRLLMKVEDKGGHGNDGFYGLTVVSEGYANDQLRKSEPPDHRTWEAHKRLLHTTSDRKEISKLISTINDLEQKVIEELFDYASRKTNTVRDIHDYCAIQDERAKCEPLADGDKEGTQLTRDGGEVKTRARKDATEGKALEVVTIDSIPSNGGDLIGGSDGGQGNGDREPGVKFPGIVDTYGPAHGSGPSNERKERRLYNPKNVKVHCSARTLDNGEVAHTLLVTSTEERIENAALKVHVEGANGRQLIPIKAVVVKDIDGNVINGKGKVDSRKPGMITDLTLSKGKNTIEVIFEESAKRFALSLNVLVD